jgi:hypothetical protein
MATNFHHVRSYLEQMLRERNLGELALQLLPKLEGPRQSRSNNFQSVLAYIPVSKPVKRRKQ